MTLVKLNKNLQYLYQIGSDNQHRLHWDGRNWNYELIAGGVLFDQQRFSGEEELEEAVAVHGLTLDQFRVDESRRGEIHSQETQERFAKLTALGINPCPKHGLTAKNKDDTCEACQHSDYPDDFKGTEG